MIKIALSIFIAGGLIAFAFLMNGKMVTSPQDSVAVVRDTGVVSQSLSMVQFKEKITNESVVVIDIRTPEEYESGYIMGALNLDFYDPEFGSNLDKLDTSKSYAIYCRSGNRSSQALLMMKERALDTVELDGGMVAWLSADMAIQCTAGKVCLR